MQWFDHWLKGVDNGLDREPPVKIFVMGRNQWRYENEYPLKRADYRKLYFRAAAAPTPAGAMDVFRGNRHRRPRNPTATGTIR